MKRVSDETKLALSAVGICVGFSLAYAGKNVITLSDSFALSSGLSIIGAGISGLSVIGYGVVLIDGLYKLKRDVQGCGQTKREERTPPPPKATHG